MPGRAGCGDPNHRRHTRASHGDAPSAGPRGWPDNLTPIVHQHARLGCDRVWAEGRQVRVHPSRPDDFSFGEAFVLPQHMAAWTCRGDYPAPYVIMIVVWPFWTDEPRHGSHKACGPNGMPCVRMDFRGNSAARQREG